MTLILRRSFRFPKSTSLLHLQPLRTTTIAASFATKPAATAASEDVPVVGPGGQNGEIATKYQQASGLERLEYLSGLAGRPLFLMDPLVVDHHGTPADPILVESLDGRRLVGCTGFPKDSHEPIWFWVTQEGAPSPSQVFKNRCAECGQAFKIKLVDGGHHHE